MHLTNAHHATPEGKSVPNDKMLDLPDLKVFADNSLSVAKMAKYVCNKVENMGGTGGSRRYRCTDRINQLTTS